MCTSWIYIYKFIFFFEFWCHEDSYVTSLLKFLSSFKFIFRFRGPECKQYDFSKQMTGSTVFFFITGLLDNMSCDRFLHPL